ncbi:ATP-dependent DNA helicase DinG [Bacillus sp. H-16]|uniref:ATP-dependent DNA helicase DinG n=1 Tax=Alteribacter salitolerans TaxID=2912333 RepID=UPI001963FA26|nr:ATP-dependent DNA helicase DinG [Alteribacter salitolerans]MBM7094618.1 ATP-dependent DNA helicase DinG [Alteribacter salitolerans]
MERFVVLDVETTGVSYKRGDRIIQLAFVVMEGAAVIERYMSYVNPGKPIPSFIQSLTNIDDEMVREAPDFSEIAPDLLKNLDGAFFVAHNVNFDLTFVNDELEACGYEPFRGPVLDTVELSRLLYPTADGFKLTQLSEEFDLAHTTPHRADSDAEATAMLLTELLNKFESLPLITLQQIKKISLSFRSDVKPLLNHWISNKERTINHSEPDIDVYRGIALSNRRFQEDAVTREKREASFDQVRKVMMNEEKMSGTMEDYEDRPGQVKMMNAIYEAFTTRQHGLIEAGTGTGKSLAYLLPAACYAIESGKPVVVATYTVQLQEQLLKKDVPVLNNIMPCPVSAALIKGRDHYISLQKFEAILAEDPYENPDRNLTKGQILVWLTETITGDVEELNLSSSGKRFWNEISAGREDEGSHAWYPYCFYHHARNKARKADLIITNHALILSDLQEDRGILPSYRQLIIDEGHHFEQAASNQLGSRLDYVSFSQLFNEAGSVDGGGILSNISRTLFDEKVSEVLKETELTVKEAKAEISELFLFLHGWAFKQKKKQNERGRITVTFDSESDSFSGIKEAAARSVYICENTLKVLMKLAGMLESKKENEELSEKKNRSFKVTFQSLGTIIDRLYEAKDTLSELLLECEENTVYWMEAETRGPRQTVILEARPVDVSALLADDLFTRKDSVVLTSATLTVNNKFDYVMKNLGLDDFPVISMVIESPFIWKDQARLMIPNDVPLLNKVDERTYIETIVLHLYRLSQVTQGKMLVLFTSYDMLKKSHELLKDILDDDFMLVSQGINGGSRTKLTKSFQQFDKAIMLGTSSFWEGVDIPGEDLTLLVMARLPFTSPDEPIYKAKAEKLDERGKSSFMSLAIPQAVIRFKQGFGRLIRKKSDRGAVIVLDRRLNTTRYGKLFVKSLPDVEIVEGSIDELEEDLKKWL